MNKKYKKKLADPRWQRKRLEVMQLDDFRCAVCKDGTSELHVHHVKYEKGLNPWEYGTDELVTLCKEHHKQVHRENIKLPFNFRSSRSCCYCTFHRYDSGLCFRGCDNEETWSDWRCTFKCANFAPFKSCGSCSYSPDLENVKYGVCSIDNKHHDVSDVCRNWEAGSYFEELKGPFESKGGSW